eukprot:m51a1_g7868 putative beta and beta-prime subunits of dna dependent rna-polymerase (1422) ;mRNA; f:275352-280573
MRSGAIKFSMLSAAEIMRVGQYQVVNTSLYQVNRQPLPDSVIDPRLGVSDKHSACATCGQRLTDCPGHWGYIRLELPVLNLGYTKQILQILQAICKARHSGPQHRAQHPTPINRFTCARLMLTHAQREPFLRRMRNPKSDSHARAAALKSILVLAKKNAVSCPHCGALNGTMKKVGTRLVHEVYKGKGATAMRAREFREVELAEAARYNAQVATHADKAQDDLNALRVQSLFSRMAPEDVEALDMDPLGGGPERLVITNVPVPPVCIRPSVAMDGAGGSNEDDLTVKLMEVVRTNKEIAKQVLSGGLPAAVVGNWETLELQVAMYINADMPGLQPQKAMHGGKMKPIRGLCQRLKGKHGRFRGNLSGKRVDFSGRTVISPDPNLWVWEVGVPLLVAKNMTYPERVTPHNIDYLRSLVRNGPDVHPGANYVQSVDGSSKRFLKFGNRDLIADRLQVGDVVERHMRDGDIVLFNRQPSLHRISIMAHRARIVPFRTFRFNECCCTPYNADFDGDEMNLHLPQTEEARAEAQELMEIRKNLITPRTGDILIASTQDFLTSAYLLSRKDTFYDRRRFAQLCACIGDGAEQVDLPPPTIVKPVELWTGKQLFRVVVRPNMHSPVLLNTECKSKTYWKDNKDSEYMCPRDGYVCFRNSELLCGVLDKATLGSGSKNCIWHVLMRDYSPNVAAEAMSRLAKLSARWIGDHGFSIGISDVTPSATLSMRKQHLVEDGYKICDRLINEFRQGKLKAQPGMNEEQTLEARLTNELSKIRDKVGEMCLHELHYNNTPLIMSQCGSKGSTINISQMVACVGQQAVGGMRIPNGFIRRTLPHFPIDSRVPAAKGFVKNSFFTGLTPSEFFFHTMGGREGLVDGAVKTAETGYMQRRLVKALEDLHIHYDTTVRNSEAVVVQFAYGEDNLDPLSMESADKPVNFGSVMMHVRNRAPCPHELPLLPREARDHLEHILATDAWASGKVSERFIADLRAFFYGCTDKAGKRTPGLLDKIAEVRARYGLHPELDAGAQQQKLEVMPFPDKTREQLLEEEAPHVPGCEHETFFEAEQPLSAEGAPITQGEAIAHKINRITLSQLQLFVQTCYDRYKKAGAEPGTAVGALAAQSLGEPGTQMTLKTFHFAGVASMNVSLGVPRIREIINATKNISTPIITAALQAPKEVVSARIVKARIERTTLGEVCSHIKEVYMPDRVFISVKLDESTLHALQLNINSTTVRAAILAHKACKALKIKDKNIAIGSEYKLRVAVPPGSKEQTFFSMQKLLRALPDVVVGGIAGANRAVINDLGNGEYNLMIEGQELRRVMCTPGVLGEKTEINHIIVVEQVLGIEAARRVIMSEIKRVMEGHGMNIDSRHIMLVGDLMTFKGTILGITRFGLSKMRESVMNLASFERTTDFLFDAVMRFPTYHLPISLCD